MLHRGVREKTKDGEPCNKIEVGHEDRPEAQRTIERTSPPKTPAAAK